MNSTPLEVAQKCLQIQDVWIRNSSAWSADDFDPKFSDRQNIGVQSKYAVSRATFFEVTDGDHDQAYLFRVFMDMGMRLIADQQSEDDSKKTRKEPLVLAQIEATMVAEYHTFEDPGQDALDAFASHNAWYHVWPFWREYLVSQCERMRLPRIFIPTMQVAQNKDKD